MITVPGDITSETAGPLLRQHVAERNRARTAPVDARFWRRVDRRGPDECWEWTGTKNADGYGQMYAFGRVSGAHRVSWRLHNSDPGVMHVLHSCDNPGCVNPAHLRLGTNRDNVNDKMARGRHPRGADHRVNVGESNGEARLTADQVLAIREDARFHKEIAAEYRISRAEVGLIKRHRTWTHVGGARSEDRRHRWNPTGPGHRAVCSRCGCERRTGRCAGRPVVQYRPPGTEDFVSTAGECPSLAILAAAGRTE